MKLIATKAFVFFEFYLVCAFFCLFAAGFSSAQNCAPPPAGLVSWWKGEGSTSDQVGGNNGSWSGGGPSYGAGEVGTAFSLNGNDCVTVPDAPNLHFTNAMTAEAWIYPTAINGDSSILVKYDAVPLNQSSFSFTVNGSGHLYLLMAYGTGQSSESVQVTSTNTVPVNQWTHVAATYDSTNLTLYINGALAGSLPETNSIFPGTDALGIGANVGGLSPGSQVAGFNGLIDETSLYNRALTAAEIAAIYNAGPAGKCTGPVRPTISVQPKSQTVYLGSDATFNVIAAGSPPVLYQWSDINGPIFGETNYSLTVPDVQGNDTYFVTVSNSVGSVVSSNAQLTVIVATAPSITAQPQPETVTAGSNALFTVTATGSMPLTYQWQFNDVPIAGATMSSLTVSNVQPAEQGDYSVIVSNIAGTMPSSEAFLTVDQPPCDPPPAGLVSWWAAEGNTSDQVGGNNGTWNGGGPDYETGEVGSAFNFNGSDNVTVPDAPNLHFTNAMTAEAWIYPTAINGDCSILVKYDAVPLNQSSFSFTVNGSGHLYLLMAYGTGQSSESVQVTSTKTVPVNQWTHVAATYDSSYLKVYINGALAGSLPETNSIFPGTDALGIGANVGGLSPGNQVAGFNGLIDEASLYNRALTAAEIAAIYNAGPAGKCAGPLAPIISAQPQNQTAYLGYSATFTAIAAGSPPLLYQWSDTNGQIIGATNYSLTISNAQRNDTYFVTVSNSVGFVVSSNALLTVLIPTCTPAPSGLVSWWAGESNTLDQVGGNSGTWSGGTNYGKGEVGTAFSFNGNDCVRVADSPNLHFTNAMTAEAWVNPSTFNANNSILVKYDGTSGVNQSSFSFSLDSSGHVYLTLSFNGTGSSSSSVTNTNTVVPLNQWTHVAATYDSSNLDVYINGALVAFRPATNSIFPGTDALGIGANIGGLSSGQAAGFTGLIDEPTLYNKALSASQIGEIYNAGPGGKCPASIAPGITVQPQNETVSAGSNIAFTVRSAGSIPLEYQWKQNSSIIAGATNSSLIISNAQVAQSGSLFSVVVSNLFGSATSSNAVLTVTPAPSVLIIPNMTATSGIVTVPINLISDGSENAIGFSVNFNTSLLTFIYADVSNEDATLIVNTNKISSGQIGLAIFLPMGAAFNAGSNILADLAFELVPPANTNTAVTPLTFGNTPIAEQVYDPSQNQLGAFFTNGNLTIPFLGYEGDVFPIPNGDGKDLLNDWVEEGRLVAGLDTITSSNEFERADCAPRSTLGDGRLTVSDWVQAGRYAAGFDPVTVAGGPTSPQAGGGNNMMTSNSATGRNLTVANCTVQAGQTCQVSVLLASQGDENGLEFSLSFPPAVLSYMSASLGSNADGAYLILNTNQIASGNLGVLLGLPIGSSFAAGSDQVLTLTLKAAPTATGNNWISFNSVPLTQEVSDTTANAVSSGYISGSVTIVPVVGPRLSVVPGKGNGLSFSYPSSASGFILQSTTSLASPNWTNAVATFTTNGNTITVTGSAGHSQMFYRLISP